VRCSIFNTLKRTTNECRCHMEPRIVRVVSLHALLDHEFDQVMNTEFGSILLSSEVSVLVTRDECRSCWMAHCSCTGAPIKAINDLGCGVIIDRSIGCPLRRCHLVLNLCSRDCLNFGSCEVISKRQGSDGDCSCSLSAPSLIILSGMCQDREMKGLFKRLLESGYWSSNSSNRMVKATATDFCS